LESHGIPAFERLVNQRRAHTALDIESIDSLAMIQMLQLSKKSKFSTEIWTLSFRRLWRRDFNREWPVTTRWTGERLKGNPFGS
jgi:hypothetical protein